MLLLEAVQRILQCQEGNESAGIAELRKVYADYQKQLTDNVKFCIDTAMNPHLNFLYHFCQILLQAENDPKYLPKELHEQLTVAFGEKYYRNCKSLNDVGLLIPSLFREIPYVHEEEKIRQMCDLKKRGINNDEVFLIMLNNLSKYSSDLHVAFLTLFELNRLNDEMIRVIRSNPKHAKDFSCAIKEAINLKLYAKEPELKQLLLKYPEHSWGLMETIVALQYAGIDHQNNLRKLFLCIKNIEYIRKLLALFYPNIKSILTQALFDAIIKYYSLDKNKGIDLSSYLPPSEQNYAYLREKSVHRHKSKNCITKLIGGIIFFLDDFQDDEITNCAHCDAIEKEIRLFLSVCAFPIIVNAEYAVEVSQALNAIYFEKLSDNCSQLSFEFFIKLFNSPIVSLNSLYSVLHENIKYFKQTYPIEKFNFNHVVSALKKVNDDFSHVLLGAIYSGMYPQIEGYDKTAVSFYHFLQVCDGNSLWKRLAVEGLFNLNLTRDSHLALTQDAQHLNTHNPKSTELANGKEDKNVENLEEDDQPENDNFPQRLANLVEREQMLKWLAARNSELATTFSYRQNHMSGRSQVQMFFPLSSRMEKNIIAKFNAQTILEKVYPLIEKIIPVLDELQVPNKSSSPSTHLR